MCPEYRNLDAVVIINVFLVIGAMAANTLSFHANFFICSQLNRHHTFNRLIWCQKDDALVLKWEKNIFGFLCLHSCITEAVLRMQVKNEVLVTPHNQQGHD